MTVDTRTVHPDPMTERDFVGYGRESPDPHWPGGAVIAVNFNLNVEGGGESTVASGDAASEVVLNDVGAPPRVGVRMPLVESVFEFGPRRGLWRIVDTLEAHEVAMSVLAVGRSVEKYPDTFRTLAAAGHEIVSHHWRWTDYSQVEAAVEREHVGTALDVIERELGQRPRGWMSGGPSQDTRRLIVEAGVSYDRDSLADELPWWVDAGGVEPHLIIPYSFETNDNRLDLANGWASPDTFFEYNRDAFDLMRAEGLAGHPKLMSIGLHDRLIGRPGRVGALTRLLDHMRQFDDVWFCTGADVDTHWRAAHPPRV